MGQQGRATIHDLESSGIAKEIIAADLFPTEESLAGANAFLKAKGYNLGSTQSPVTPVFLNGTEYEAGNLILEIRERYNIFCSMVIYPIVPKNIILLRIIPTAAHSIQDVNDTIAAFDAVRENLKSGKYRQEGIVNTVENMS